MQAATLEVDKWEAQQQWDGDACGASTVGPQYQPGTLAFYREARRVRYTEYAPWFDDIVQFDAIRGQRVLEIGVGLGSDHYRFARHGNEMTALDLSRGHLQHTAQHLALEGLTTDPIYGDAEAMPFDAARFDVVYSFGVLHHTPSIERALAEVRRVLKPGGRAIIGLYHRHSYYFWIQKMLAEGLLKGGLVTKGYRRVMSEIEYRSSDNTAEPLVNVYSRRDVRALFADFRALNVRTCHVEPVHFYRLAPLVARWSRDRLERVFGGGGWYVMAEATR